MANVDVWVSKQITLRFGWWEDSQSATNNSSVVGWHLQLIASGGYISSSASKSWSVTVNGTNYSGTNTVGISSGQTRTLASGSTTIGHNADGTKSFSFSFSQQFDITYSDVGWIGTKSGSGSGTLSTIPRTSSVSSTNGYIGESITISINSASSSFTHTLTYKFYNLTGTIATKTSSTNISWTIPTSFYSQIPNLKSSWDTITCDTYSGSTKIGSSTCRFDVYVKESTNRPTLYPTVTDTDSKTIGLTGDENTFIKYYSSAYFNFSASPKNSSSISSYSLIAGSQASSSSYGTLYNVDSANFSFSVTDSRGFSATQVVSKSLINYIKLTCALNTSMNTDGTLYLKMTGNYFNGSFGAVNNSLQVAYRYKEIGGSYSDWYNVDPTISGNYYSAATNVFGLEYQKVYIVQAWAGDKIYEVGIDGGAYTKETQVTARPIFDWGRESFHFHVPVSIDDTLGFGQGGYLYGLGNDDSAIFLAWVEQSDNSVALGTSTKHTTINSGDTPTWYNAYLDSSYNIWTDRDCISTSDSICRTWRYPNGMQVSVIKVSGNWNVNTAWGSVYSSPWISGQSFNVAFLEEPRVTINAYNDNSTAMMVCQCSKPTTTATGACYLWKPVAQTGTRIHIEYIAIGRWK